jgi:hypothetical protein
MKSIFNAGCPQLMTVQDLHGVVGGRNVGLKPNSDLSILSESVRRLVLEIVARQHPFLRNVDVMFINAAKIH